MPRQYSHSDPGCTLAPSRVSTLIRLLLSLLLKFREPSAASAPPLQVLPLVHIVVVLVCTSPFFSYCNNRNHLFPTISPSCPRISRDTFDLSLRRFQRGLRRVSYRRQRDSVARQATSFLHAEKESFLHSRTQVNLIEAETSHSDPSLHLKPRKSRTHTHTHKK